MIKLRDKVKYNESHIDNLDNYLALAATILSVEEDFTMQQYFGLYDKKESQKRKKEIDEIRKNGGKTELEVWYRNSVNTDPCCRQGNKKILRNEEIDEFIESEGLFIWGQTVKNGKSKPCLLIDNTTGKWLIYKNVKEACTNNHINYTKVKYQLRYNRKQINFENYIFRKLT